MQEIRSKKELEIFLQKLKGNRAYRIDLEQYPTDTIVASNILNTAYLDGNIEEKMVADLGSGNGIFAVGAALLGAKKVYAVESDPTLVEVLKENAKGLNIEILNEDVSKFNSPVDTVIMNPPFGSVMTHSDRKFLKKAVESAGVIYSIHNSKSSEYVEKFYKAHGEIIRKYKTAITVPRIYKHHTMDRAKVDCVVFTLTVDHP
ncbi:MAG: METTL5 family protein [Thermoplasmatales archaeon]|nr:METTL5 family protein [Thermoplasmatales archaeon]MCW6169750.1 METTL5 family protein [Thermoplasmatales archaeon]